MALDLDALVAPLSEDAPSGPDLYADGERQAIEAAFERSVSEGGGGDDEVDWNDVYKRIVAQAEQTRDLWLPVYMMRAGTSGGRFERVAEGAQFFARMLEDRWEDCHPQLEELGFIGRKTPCESLTRLGEFLNPLQRMPLLIHSRLGSYSGLDFIRFQTEGGNAENFGMFRALLEDVGEDPLREIVARFDELTDGIRRGDDVMTANSDGDTSTNFEATYDVLKKLRQAVASFLPDEPVMVESSVDDGESAGESGGASASSQARSSGSDSSFTGGIASRADVVRAIDAICAYYSKYEPGSPVPLALRRVREWTSLDFMAVLKDIAPAGISEAGTVLNLRASGSSSSGSAGSSDDSWGSSSSDDTWGDSSSDSSSDSDGWG